MMQKSVSNLNHQFSQFPDSVGGQESPPRPSGAGGSDHDGVDGWQEAVHRHIGALFHPPEDAR